MLTLPIKKQWFDMILSGEKTEEYRDVSGYWTVRFWNAGLIDLFGTPRKNYSQKICFRNGYSKNSPSFVAACSCDIGRGRPEWGADPNKEYFILKILKISEVVS